MKNALITYETFKAEAIQLMKRYKVHGIDLEMPEAYLIDKAMDLVESDGSVEMELLYTSKKHQYTEMRQCLYYIMWKHLNVHHLSIAEHFGQHRSNVMYSINKFSDFLDMNDEKALETYNQIMNILNLEL